MARESDALVAPAGLARLTAPWPWPHKSRQPEKLPGAGELVRLGARNRAGYASTGMDGYGYSAKVDDLQLELHPPLTWRDFPALLDFYLHGGAQLPNLEVVDQRQGLNAIASWGGAGVWPSIAHVLLPGRSRTTWARVFLGNTQGGKLDGTGYLLAYESDQQTMPQVRRFQLCAHRKVAGYGANPMRGWNPGSCSRCGLNMTVDSSD